MRGKVHAQKAIDDMATHELREKGVRQGCKSTDLRRLSEAGGNKVLERLTEGTGQDRRVLLGDQKENSHWMELGMRRSSRGHLYRGDAQRPDVCLLSVALLARLDHLP